MGIYLDLFIITLIVVSLIDCSGFIGEIEGILAKKLKVSKERVHIPKPFSCSYCMSHHIGLLYLLFNGQFNILVYFYLLQLAFLTPIFGDILYLVKDVLEIAIRALTPND